ncbi:MAG: hypothetical protein HQL58_12765 [Magnetococcales bacterium]|nr:hypothetical protein [Magnetococcales bacterium]
MREALRLVPVPPPLYISTVADLPAASGLGSSSSFCVGLLNALHVMRGERVCPTQLIEESVHIEVDILKNPIGKQDQAAAAIGGLNLIRFLADERITLEPVNIAHDNLRILSSYMQVFWTGITRSSAEILSEQQGNIGSRKQYLDQMREQAVLLSDIVRLQQFDIHKFASVLDHGWQLKRHMASSISSDQIDQWYDLAKANGALGGKICGAGGGGFLLFLTPPEKHQAVIQALSLLMLVPVGFEFFGSHVVHQE